MKTAPIQRALAARPDRFEHLLIHTGQHYDRAMSDVFFEQLGVGAPDHMLDVGSGTHGAQTALVMTRLEPLLQELEPDLVLVPGDVNSTLAAALTAAKLEIPVAHVEAGLRSFDRTMPEEINRVVTDQISDLLFIHSPEARDHLVAEGRDERDILAVGNTMIDTLVALRGEIEREDAPGRLGLDHGGYLVVTLHRPALVDGPLLADAMAELSRLAGDLEVVFPAHPRTRQHLEAEGIDTGGVRLLDPMPYLSFLSLVARRGRRADRLRRHPGGDDVPGHPVLHAARQHRAPGHVHAGHQHPARARARADRRGAGSPRRRPRDRAVDPAAVGRPRRRTDRRPARRA